MALFPGWTAPDFTTETAEGPIHFHAWLDGGWGIVVTHPDDYSLRSLRGAAAWARSCTRPVKLLGLSSRKRNAFVAGIPDFPIVQGDAERIASLWRGATTDVGSNDAPFDEHAVFIVNAARTIQTTISYPSSCDRNFGEIIQVMKAFDAGCHSTQRTRRAA